jgi:hypothetical protein
MKGIFRRKDTKLTDPGSQHDKVRPAVTVDRISNYSHKSPTLMNSKASLPSITSTMPEVSIPDPPDPRSKPAAYLRSIHAVRDRSRLVLEEAKVNALNHFDVDISKFKDTADYVIAIIKARIPRPAFPSIVLHEHSATSRVTMLRYLLMVDGSILKSGDGQE